MRKVGEEWGEQMETNLTGSSNHDSDVNRSFAIMSLSMCNMG